MDEGRELRQHMYWEMGGTQEEEGALLQEALGL